MEGCIVVPSLCRQMDKTVDGDRRVLGEKLDHDVSLVGFDGGLILLAFFGHHRRRLRELHSPHLNHSEEEIKSLLGEPQLLGRVMDPIDDETGCPLQAHGYRVVILRLHFLLIGVFSKSLGKGFDVQIQLFGIAGQHLIGHSVRGYRAPLLLPFIEQLVHFPEGPLRAGRLGRFGGDHRLVVYGDKWEVSINLPYIAFLSVCQTLKQWTYHCTGRSLEVTVFNQDDGRVVRSH